MDNVLTYGLPGAGKQAKRCSGFVWHAAPRVDVLADDVHSKASRQIEDGVMLNIDIARSIKQNKPLTQLLPLKEMLFPSPIDARLPDSILATTAHAVERTQQLHLQTDVENRRQRLLVRIVEQQWLKSTTCTP